MSVSLSPAVERCWHSNEVRHSASQIAGPLLGSSSMCPINALICSLFLQSSVPRGVIPVKECLTIKGAEDAINKAHAFELSTVNSTFFFIADSDKVRDVN
jgi:hypothetical protein